MDSRPTRTLGLAAALMLTSAAIISFAVIPLVRRDTFSRSTPDTAISAFLGVALIGILLAAAPLAAARISSSHPALGRVLSGVAGVLSVLLGLLLIDAALAYAGHGRGMLGAVVALWACVVFDVAAGGSMVGVAFKRPLRAT
jgi:hypothetical protein